MVKGGLMVAMGDSFTWTSVNQGSNLYVTKTWRAICDQYGEIRHINKGIGNTTSAAMVTNLQWLYNFDADLVTIGVGMNDAKNNQVSVSDYKVNLRIIIDFIKAKKADTHVVLCTPARTSDANRSTLPDYRTAMAEVATEKGVSLCRFEDAYSDEEIPTHTNDDLLHPNIAGHQRLFETLYPVIRQGFWLSRLQE